MRLAQRSYITYIPYALLVPSRRQRIKREIERESDGSERESRKGECQEGHDHEAPYRVRICVREAEGLAKNIILRESWLLISNTIIHTEMLPGLDQY